MIQELKWQIRKLLVDHYPRMIIDHEWPPLFGRKVDWVNPRDLNEKIQWLMCYSDTSEWVRLADKYRVREFVEERGLGHLLTQLYGVWDNADDIDYDSLPEKFVLKCNHDSGSTYFIDKTKGFDIDNLNSTLNQRLKRKFGYLNCEPYYNKIKPLIIAEEWLEDKSNDFSTSVIDYKFWCFDGQPYRLCAYYSRSAEAAYVNEFDLDWNVHPECSIFTDHYRDGQGKVQKPVMFDKMVEYVKILSKGFPLVRVDLYNIGGKIYLGEMTFSPGCGRYQRYTQEYLIELGNQIVLPAKHCPIKR